MIVAALAFAAAVASARYESVFTKEEVPVFEAGAAKYEFYAETDLDKTRKVVVFGFTPLRRGTEADVPHQVFVTIIQWKGNVFDIVAPRRDVTDALLTIGERGRFSEIRARVNAFTLRLGHYVDVNLWSSITGGASQASDALFRISSDGVLINAGHLDETEALSRKDGREISQTSSKLAVGDGALVWTKKERLASRDDRKKPYRVHCRTTRTTYRPLGLLLVESEKPAKGKLKPLDRVPVREIVPCCDGCRINP